MVNDNFKLPRAAFVNKFIPKNKFYEKAALKYRRSPGNINWLKAPSASQRQPR